MVTFIIFKTNDQKLASRNQANLKDLSFFDNVYQTRKFAGF